MLTVGEAENLLVELKEREVALGRAPETWYFYENHVKGAAKVARTIAERIKSMNPDEVYVCALLHDICRTDEGREQCFHGILGYEKMISVDEKVARTALIHMFPWNVIPPFEKCKHLFFDNKKDYDFVLEYVKNTEPTDFDLLIQLADALANKDGFVTIEERAREYAERHGFEMPKHVIDDVCRLKDYFDKKIGVDIYSLFTKID